MKTLVLLTGPLGTNFKKINSILTEDSKVCDLSSNSEYNALWDNPTANIKKFNWEQSNYYVAAISCPTINDQLPAYFKFLNEFQKMDFRIVVAIVGTADVKRTTKYQKKMLGRDANLEFYASIEKLNNFCPIYISGDLLSMYKDEYCKFLQNYLKVPLVLATVPTVTETINN